MNGAQAAVLSAAPRLDLRAAVAAAPLALPGLEQVPLADRTLAKEYWGVHMVAEFASARVFAGLVPQLMAASLPFETVREVVEMSKQELDHGLLSARVYAALGGVPDLALPELAAVPDHAGCSPLEVVLRNVIAIACCGETVAVAVVGGERERTTIAPLHQILTTILADEVGHSRFGWRLLRDVASAIDGELARRLSAYLVAIFERDLRVTLAGAQSGAVSWAALSLGAHDGPLHSSTVIETFETVTVPGLARHGLQAEWAYNQARKRVGLEAVQLA